MKDILVRIGGEGGEGVISCGELLTTALARSNHEVFTFRTYPAEIKGGPAMFQVRAGDETVLSQGKLADILVTFNEEAFQLQGHTIHPDGLLVYDPAHYQPKGNFECYPVPLDEITMTVVKSKLGKNVVALGVVARILGMPINLLEELVRDRFGKKGDIVVAKNHEALRAGYTYVDQHLFKKAIPKFEARTSTFKRVVMSGNEALSIGAISAGCRYYGGYPHITPASDILEFMEKDLPKFGGAVVQTEDEIAAIASVVGASYAGKKSMTATSGPGLSLMVEVMGLATMSEIPCVIVDAQRSGPSTGMPTKTEQSDLNLAVFGSHGDAPRIVLAPGNVEECLYYIIHAFNLAEKYQSPVIFLTDQSLAHRTQTFPWPDFKRVPIVNRLTPTDDELKEYKRFKLTENGVSPMAIPGSGGVYAATGLEHTERGAPNFTPQMHMTMLGKRAKKIEFCSKEKGFTARFGLPKAKVGIIGWGSTQGSILEGVQMAIKEGLSVAHLQLKMIQPLPEADIQEFINSVDEIIIAELNYGGQFNQIFRSRFLLPTHPLTKCDGLPFYAEEILSKIKAVSAGEKAAAVPALARS